MEKNVFLVKWYGPFECKEDVRDWEQEQSFKSSLYLLHGKRRYAKTNEKYYCGMSERNVYERLSDKKHHIEEIQNRPHSIYVGCLSNIKNPTRNQIKLVEKIIISSLTYIVGEENVLNATNKLFPAENIFVINEWWKTTGESTWKRQRKNAPSNIIPDVLTFHYKENNDNELFCCKKLKQL